MCAPIAGLALAGVIASGLAGTIGTIAKVQQANMQASVAEANANNEKQAAAQDQTSMNQAALTRYQQISQMEGQQRAAQAANGAVVDYGSSGQQVADTGLLGATDVNKIYQQGFQAQRAHDVNISNDYATASAAKSQAVMAGIGGAFGTAGSVLGGLNQYDALRRAMGVDTFQSGTALAQVGNGMSYNSAAGLAAMPGVRSVVQLPPNYG